MVRNLERWHAEHHNFSRLLDLVDAWTKRFRAGEDVDYELLRDVMYYMTHYPDRFHHPLEDVVFAELARRDVSLRAPVAELAAQHERIAVDGKALVDDLDAIVGGAVLAREAVAADAERYATHMRRHMASEEEKLMPAVARQFSEADWEAARQQLGGVDADPLFGEAVEQRYAGLQQEIARQVGCDCIRT